MPEGKTLRNLLKGDLKIQIEEIWRKRKEYHSSQRGDYIQGVEHCETVESNLYRLIPDDKKEELKQIELFLLSVAACLHDIGKIADGREWEDYGKRSKQIILENYDKLGLDKGQAVAVACIVSVHNHGRLDELPRNLVVMGNEEIDIIELAAIFRLAVMLDTTYRGVPEILSTISFFDKNVPPKLRGRQAIIGWYLDGKRIILQAIPRKDEIDAVYTLWAMMKEELSRIAYFLSIYGYPSELGKLDMDGLFLESGYEKRGVRQRPFPGMAFYTKEDACVFRGRDDETEKLLSNVSAFPITLLVGESGVGKTSLIHAGLFPWLEKMSWKYVWTRPLDNPTENIKKMVWNAFFEGEGPDEIGLLDVMKQVAKKHKPQKVLIVIDQSEDVLSCSDQEALDDFSRVLMAVQTGVVVPNLRILISFREDALVKLSSRLLRKITGSTRQFPSVELEGLTREGAKSALLAGLKNAGIGLDPRQKDGEKSLIEIILDDIQKGRDRLYPPFVQMIAQKLCKKVDLNNPIVTREMYSELGNVDDIVTYYLIELLDEFGSKKEKAEKVLISLTSLTGDRVKKSLTELKKETGIEIDELKEIMEKMFDLRMVRAVGEDGFEIIHDYLGEIIKATREKPVSRLWRKLKSESDPNSKGKKLEQLAGAVFSEIPGFSYVIGNVRSSNEEIDIMFRNESSDPFWNQQGSFIMVECRYRSKDKAEREDLDTFATKMERRGCWCRVGFFVSLSGFTRGFVRSVREKVMKNFLVVPIDHDQFEKLIEANPTNRSEILKEFIFLALNM